MRFPALIVLIAVLSTLSFSGIICPNEHSQSSIITLDLCTDSGKAALGQSGALTEPLYREIAFGEPERIIEGEMILADLIEAVRRYRPPKA